MRIFTLFHTFLPAAAAAGSEAGPASAADKVYVAKQEKGIDFDFDRITPQDLEEPIVHRTDLTLEAEGKENVGVYCE